MQNPCKMLAGDIGRVRDAVQVRGGSRSPQVQRRNSASPMRSPPTSSVDLIYGSHPMPSSNAYVATGSCHVNSMDSRGAHAQGLHLKPGVIAGSHFTETGLYASQTPHTLHTVQQGEVIYMQQSPPVHVQVILTCLHVGCFCAGPERAESRQSVEMHEVGTMRHAHLQAIESNMPFQFQQIKPMIIDDPSPSRPRAPSPEPGLRLSA